MNVTELNIPFGHFHTYCRIAGAPSDRPPLLLLHGGPGSTHNYFELLDGLEKRAGRQLIMYDQLGCGRSSIPDDQPELYTAGTWVAELVNLRRYLGLDQVYLLGQSWGGMLAIIYLCDYQPQGVEGVILSSTLSSARLWASELHRLIKFMPEEEQAAIRQAEQTGDFTSPVYQRANAAFMTLHVATPATPQSPEPLRRVKRGGEVAYLTAWGPNKYNPLGNLKDYEYTAKLDQIKIPALVIDGTNDLCTPLVAKTMFDHLPWARWQLFQGARHMVFAEQTAAYERTVVDWLMAIEN